MASRPSAASGRRRSRSTLHSVNCSGRRQTLSFRASPPASHTIGSPPISAIARSRLACAVRTSSRPASGFPDNRSKPPKLPVVSASHSRWSPSRSIRLSGFQKLIRRTSAMALPRTVAQPSQIVCRPRPRYSAPSHITRSRRLCGGVRIGPEGLQHLASRAAARCARSAPTRHAARRGSSRGRRSRRMSPIIASRTRRDEVGPSAGSSSKSSAGRSKRARTSSTMRLPVVP